MSEAVRRVPPTEGGSRLHDLIKARYFLLKPGWNRVQQPVFILSGLSPDDECGPLERSAKLVSI
jgi:hypothetical protein